MPLVMVVDDAAFMRVRCARMLTENGYQVLEAEDGAQAVKLYASSHPDAVLMDITMPQMNGLEALVAIRQLDPAAKIAMVTAMGQQNIVMEALKAGARDFVVKPFQSDRVLSAVKRLVG